MITPILADLISNVLYVVIALAVGILLVLPPLQMPSVTRFIDGTGPIFAGALVLHVRNVMAPRVEGGRSP